MATTYTPGEYFGAACLIVGWFAAYWTPSFIALSRKRVSTGAIIALNGLAGWTCIGWIIAFCWALSGPATNSHNRIAGA